jgi:hypothetical protein
VVEAKIGDPAAGRLDFRDGLKRLDSAVDRRPVVAVCASDDRDGQLAPPITRTSAP